MSGDRPTFSYAPADPEAVPALTVVTRVRADAAGLDGLAARLRGQSLQQWEWLLVDEGAAPGRLAGVVAGDRRIHVLAPGAPVRAAAAHMVEVAPTDALAPTTLETRLWALHTGTHRNGARPDPALGPVQDELPFTNRLAKSAPRLLLLVPWLDAGGAEKFTLDLLRQLAARGWECTVATTLAGRDHWRADFLAVTPDVFVLHALLPLADHPRFLRYLIDSRRVDAVLIAHSLFAYLALPYLRARCPDTAFLDYCHVVEPDWQQGGYPHLAVAYQELLDLNVVSSAHLRGWMMDHGADDERIEICTTNVDSAHWTPDPAAGARVRRELGLDPEAPLVVYAARLCPQKQPAVFADTMRRLRDAGARFTALVAGDGPEHATLAGLLKRHRLTGHVRLLGLVPNDRVRTLLQAADVFFLPSRYEGIALAAFEAMACGVCVVSADVGGQRELITPECGILVTPADPDTEAARYAEALRALLADPARRRTLGEAARARVTTAFPLTHMGDRMAALLAEASRRHVATPHLAAGAGLARALAEQAVTCARASALTGAIDPYRTSWRTLAYFAARNLLLPAYDRLTRDRTWPATLKNALKAALLRP